MSTLHVNVFPINTLKKKIGFLCGCLLLSASAFSAVDSDLSRNQFGDQWVASWGAAPMASDSAFKPIRTFENQTIRQFVHISAGGTRVRIRISNAFGTQPLRIGSAHVALPANASAASGSAIVPSSDRALKFSGLPSITIPVGAVALSDPIDFVVASRANLAVSIYLPTNTGPATYHDNAKQTAYITGPGDFTGATTLPSTAEVTLSRYFLSVVEVATYRKLGAVVTIGDSITEGGLSTDDTNRRWPDVLSARLNPTYGRPTFGVVNQGVGCGRLLFELCGQGGAARFDRDVLAVTGVTHVIEALGLVDIIFPGAFGSTDQIVSASDIIVGLKQTIDRAHAQNVLIYGATITPVGSTPVPGVFTPENEAKRQAVNKWIRTSHAFDGVIDFDAVVRDPNDPTRLWSIYNGGDGIHPNDAGNEAMANAIDIGLFSVNY